MERTLLGSVGVGGFGWEGGGLQDGGTQEDEMDWRLGEEVRFLMNSLHFL